MSREISPNLAQRTANRFRAPAIFHRVCAHEVANLQAKATALFKSHRYADAKELLRVICDFDSADPSHRIHLAKAQAMTNDLQAAASSLDAVLEHPSLNVIQRRHVLETVGDISVASDAATLTHAREYEEADIDRCRSECSSTPFFETVGAGSAARGPGSTTCVSSPFNQHATKCGSRCPSDLQKSIPPSHIRLMQPALELTYLRSNCSTTMTLSSQFIRFNRRLKANCPMPICNLKPTACSDTRRT